jgi:hypothetical protein
VLRQPRDEDHARARTPIDFVTTTRSIALLSRKHSGAPRSLVIDQRSRLGHKQGIQMNAKIILSAVLFAVVFAAVHPVLAGQKAHPTSHPSPLSAQANPVPIRGDLHLFLKAF